MALEKLFNDIAAAIHEKDGKTDGIVAEDFPSRIRAIPSGGLDGVILESIEIVTPPKRTTYLVGEKFDPTGMVVHAIFSNAQTMQVDHSNLTFDPSGPLSIDANYISVNFQWGIKMASASQSIQVVEELVWWSPKMTSSVEPAPYKVSASGAASEAYAPYKALDGDAASGWSSSNETSKWLLFDFGVPTSVKAIRIYPCSWHIPASFKSGIIQGSNDGEVFADILEFNNAIDSQTQQYQFKVIEEYRYYRFYNLTSSYGPVATNEIEFLTTG